MPEETADLMEEWKSLRDEVARKQEFVERLILVTVAGDLAIFSFAATRQIPTPIDAFIALLSIALTTASYFWILRNFYSGMRISQYIKDVIEPKTGLYWENWVHQSRRRTDPGARPRIHTDVFSNFYHALLGLSLIVSIILIWAPQWHYVGKGTPQPLRVSVATSTALTVGAVLFVIVWYVLANIAFVSRIRSDIRQLMIEMQRTSGSPDEQGQEPISTPFPKGNPQNLRNVKKCSTPSRATKASDRLEASITCQSINSAARPIDAVNFHS